MTTHKDGGLEAGEKEKVGVFRTQWIAAPLKSSQSNSAVPKIISGYASASQPSRTY